MTTIVLLLGIGVITAFFIQHQENQRTKDANVHTGTQKGTKEIKDLMKKSNQQYRSVSDGSEGNSLSFSLEKIVTNADTDKKVFKYTIKNETDKEQKLSYTTSQRYDYEIKNEDEEIIFKYSKERIFMQVLGDVILSPNEEKSYEISIPPLDEGKYTLTVFATARHLAQSRKSIQFTVKK